MSVIYCNKANFNIFILFFEELTEYIFVTKNIKLNVHFLITDVELMSPPACYKLRL